MISVLIPTYNYNILELVNSIIKQLTESQIAYEIICFEDGSDTEFIDCNSEINKLPYTQLLVSNENVGRIKARQSLSDNAQYDWLLFLDADVLPKDQFFIKKYIESLNNNYDVYYGGFSYESNPPSKHSILRWKYGKKHEEVLARIRNKKPCKVIISANFLIKKSTFFKISNYVNYNSYGLDSYIGAKLKEHKINVFHIDNTVLHLGIEESNVFLEKKKQASRTLIKLFYEEGINNHDNDLLTFFIKIKRIKINYLFSLLFRFLKNPIEKNLLSKNPSITLLQFYRISYMCFYDLNSKTQE